MSPDYEINVDPDMANRDSMTIFINLYEILRKSGAYFKLRCGQSRIRIRSARGSYKVYDYLDNL